MYKINDLPITKSWCSAGINVGNKSYTKDVPKLCALEDPSNPFRAPFIPIKTNTDYRKNCTKDGECNNLDKWDGSDNANDFSKIEKQERTKFKSKCIKSSICSVDGFNGGVNPSKITSSKDILKNYNDWFIKFRWGECWTFSGILTTICRTLGIPCRQVSGFEIARQKCAKIKGEEKQCEDGMGKFTLEVNAKVDDKGIPKFSDDIFMWTFHCWNDVWMSRKDLKKYNQSGWQMVDSTPQELSFGVNQAGPYPLKALKNKDLNIDYDSRFLNTEINYDMIVEGKRYPTRAEIYTGKVGTDYNALKIIYENTDPRLYSLAIDNINNEYVHNLSTRNALMSIQSRPLIVNIQYSNIKDNINIQLKLLSSKNGNVNIIINFVPVLYTGKVISKRFLTISKIIPVLNSRQKVINYSINASSINTNETRYFQVSITAIYPDKSKEISIKSIYLSQ